MSIIRQLVGSAAPAVLLVAVLLMPADTAQAAAEDEQSNPRAPLVPAYERFGKHQVLSSPQAGALLASELSCTACHQSARKSKNGPNLSNVGERIRTSQLRSFLTDPSNHRPGTTMPDLLSGFRPDQRSEIIDSLVSFLSAQRTGFPEIRGSGRIPVPFQFWTRGNADRGRTLFHTIGCVACHAPDADYPVTVTASDRRLEEMLEQLDPEELQELGLYESARRVESVPLHDPAGKFSRQSLTHFLLDPYTVHAESRMPHFGLLPTEAADLAEWLMVSRSNAATDNADVLSEIPHPAAGNDAAAVAAGRRWFNRLGCSACHRTGPGERPDDDPADAGLPGWESLDPESATGCLTAGDTPAATGNPSTPVPRWHFTDGQRDALLSALRETESDDEQPPQRIVFQTLATRNCFACHEREGLGGVGRFRRAYFSTAGEIDFGDEGRLPPPLTGVGAKLIAGHMTRVLRGDGAVRPHLQIRMPQFRGTDIEALPQVLAACDVSDTTTGQKVSAADSVSSLRDAGRSLMDTGCVQCHQFAGNTLPGIVGVELSGISGRVREDWFIRFMRNPTGLKKNTRMPTFFPNGRSQRADVLDGDPDRQIAAMWHYLKTLPQGSLPATIERARSADYELRPTDRPVILRTFMQNAGPHAVAVGFPTGIHLAFDAEHLRLAEIWTGRFLDAEGTWFVRSAPAAAPLGTSVAEFETLAGVEIDNNPADIQASFRGYRVRPDGTPVFQYRIGSLAVTDEFTSPDSSTIRRVIGVRQVEDSDESVLKFRVASLRPDSPPKRINVTVTVQTSDESPDELAEPEGRTVNDLTEGGPAVIELRPAERAVIEYRASQAAP